jgi:hypothetical protein
MKRLITISLLLLIVFSQLTTGCNASRRGCGCAANVHAIGMVQAKKLNNKI